MRHRLVALILALGLAAPLSAETLSHISTFFWPSETINGVSGLEMSTDGARFAAVSDLGWYLSGTFKRQDGRITGVTLEQFSPLLGQDGLPVAARRVGDWSDAEGLAIAPDGTHFIVFERWMRAARYVAPDAAADFIKDHPDFRSYPENRQLEATALAPDGTLYAFAEKPARRSGDFPVYVLRENGWSIEGAIAPEGGFSITGADFGPDGRLFLLERKLILGLWWQSQIRVFDAPRGSGQVLWRSNPGAFYNLEGIAVWQGADGLRLTVISDNNRRRSEPTQIVEFRLTE